MGLDDGESGDWVSVDDRRWHKNHFSLESVSQGLFHTTTSR